MKIRINFITNLDIKETSGGWSGISAKLFQNIGKHFETTYVGPISPKDDFPAKLMSKLNRSIGRRGTFHFFSTKRLKRIARAIDDCVNETADYDFFHGQTPWILFDSPRPYGVYIDACFSTYLNIYQDRSKFIEADIQRICDLEIRWLQKATHVFFGSRWALEETVHEYNISSTNFQVVGVGGCVPVPERDVYAGGLNFLFIALDFERKGGRICCEAFSRVRAEFPQAQLTLIGERPPEEILAMPGVTYGGFLRKTVPLEFQKLQEYFANGFALIHPTEMDTMGMVLIEAGYHGCPSVTACSFGIPELIKDGETGFLIEPPLTVDSFASRMLEFCRDPESYRIMRRLVRHYTTNNLTWETVGNKIAHSISQEGETREL